ncbi:hypothetical protein TWF694_007267 [Orbilia ellipsospora]|uniref:Transmembrane protein n=1 Tax=Orbilia ellipsospora TaxID=2528407 RepID=A0AAV9XHC3_9PEZI
MTRTSTLLGILSTILSSTLFSSPSYANFDWTYPTKECTTTSALGQAQACCDQTCSDGTNVGFPGACLNFQDYCKDPKTVPTCKSNQVFSGRADKLVDTGGKCFPTCNWANWQYAFNCCDCPAGYVSAFTNCKSLEGVNLATMMPCVGCLDKTKTLTFDKSTGQYSCVASGSSSGSDAELCAKLLKYKQWARAVGNLNAWAGVLCPANLKKAFIAFKPGGALYAWISALNHPTRGLTGTEFTATTAVLNAFNTLTIAYGFAAAGIVAADIAPYYASVCAFSGGLGIVSAGTSIVLGAIRRHNDCPTDMKRSISDFANFMELEISPSYSLTRRDGDYNPCSDFLSYFPTNFTLAADLDSECNSIEGVDASGIEDSDIATGIMNTQTFCRDYQNSGNSTRIIEFQTFLSALQGAVPYCTINATELASLSSSYTTPSTIPLPTTFPNTSIAIMSPSSIVTDTGLSSGGTPISNGGGVSTGSQNSQSSSQGSSTAAATTVPSGANTHLSLPLYFYAWVISVLAFTICWF